MAKRILVFGASTAYGRKDSSGGWVEYLKNLFPETPKGPEYYVYNLSVVGDTTKSILDRFEQEVNCRIEKGNDENIILFMTGTNDAAILLDKNKPRIDIEDSEKNIQKIIDLALKFTKNVIFIENPIPDDKRTNPVGWNENLAYLGEKVVKLNLITQGLCIKNKVQYIPLPLLHDPILEDGLHPGTEGHKKIFDIIIKSVSQFN